MLIGRLRPVFAVPGANDGDPTAGAAGQLQVDSFALTGQAAHHLGHQVGPNGGRNSGQHRQLGVELESDSVRFGLEDQP